MTNNPHVPQSGFGGGQPGAAPLASWGKRAQGWVLDYFAPGLVISFIAGLMPGNTTSGNTMVFGTAGKLVSTGLSVAWYLYMASLSAKTGQTWGRKWAKTQLLGESGAPLTLGSGFVRYLAHFLDTVACLIGWFFPLWDKERQTFADKIMKTHVYDVSQTGLLGRTN